MGVKIKDIIKNTYIVFPVFYLLKGIIAIFGEKEFTKVLYRLKMKTKLNIEEPILLNEKIQWLKLNYYAPFYRQCCDKYLVHDYLLKKCKEDLAVPMLFVCKNAKEFSLDKITHFPCIIKISSGSGQNLIIHSRKEYSNKYIRSWIKRQIANANLHTLWSREHQYIGDVPYIVVEELLRDSDGGIPNDYKFLFMNGELQFIYCSVDRLGINVRQIYDISWNRLPFIWVKGGNREIYERFSKSDNIPPPSNFDEMLRIGKEIANDFPMVRIDFYNILGKIYIGELTLHHGSGYDKFYPNKYDLIYGKRLILPQRNR